MTALLDADILAYRAAHVGTTKFSWGGDDDDQDVQTNLPLAKDVAATMVRSWTKRAGDKVPLLIFSDRTYSGCTFRYRIHPHYKALRPAEKPPLHDDILAFLKATFSWRESPGLEGDDLMGLLATGEGGSKYVIVSVDKDMTTIPARQHNPDKDDDGVVRKPSLFAADYAWMMQTLTGDTVDNYKGCPGVGEKGAIKALAGCTNLDLMWDRTLVEYDKKFIHKTWGEKFIKPSAAAEALMNARVARILRFGDYHKGQVLLWSPQGDYGYQDWIDAFVPEGEDE